MSIITATCYVFGVQIVGEMFPPPTAAPTPPVPPLGLMPPTDPAKDTDYPNYLCEMRKCHAVVVKKQTEDYTSIDGSDEAKTVRFSIGTSLACPDAVFVCSIWHHFGST